MKDSKGLLAKQLDTLKDPKQLAQIGFSEGTKPTLLPSVPRPPACLPPTPTPEAVRP